jgi:hypothetical protein
MKRATKTPDHIVIGPKGRFQCEHCGGTFNPFADGPLDIGLLPGIMSAFTKKHKGCKKLPKDRCHYCLTFDHASADHVNKTTRGPRDWPDCGDTGNSSEAIWAHMTGASRRTSDYPLDPSDFGRCHRLLHAPWAVGWRARLGEMARYGAVWKALVTCWDELEALYVEELPTGSAPKLYAKMSAIRAPHER